MRIATIVLLIIFAGVLAAPARAQTPPTPEPFAIEISLIPSGVDATTLAQLPRPPLAPAGVPLRITLINVFTDPMEIDGGSAQIGGPPAQSLDPISQVSWETQIPAGDYAIGARLVGWSEFTTFTLTVVEIGPVDPADPTVIAYRSAADVLRNLAMTYIDGLGRIAKGLSGEPSEEGRQRIIGWVNALQTIADTSTQIAQAPDILVAAQAFEKALDWAASQAEVCAGWALTSRFESKDACADAMTAAAAGVASAADEIGRWDVG